MRHISFALTTPQFKARTKTVTRRIGWRKVKVGDVLMGVEKGQGIPKGGKVTKLGPIRVKGVNYERIDRMATEKEYGDREAKLEGFPMMTGVEFVAMFCEHNGADPTQEITRIEYEYL